MRYATAFRAEQKIDVEHLEEAAPWTLTLEEMIPRDIDEPEEGEEPFTLTVRRGTVSESYGSCRWTSHSRQDTQEGLQKRRTAQALTRTVERQI